MATTAELRRVGPYEVGSEVGRGATSRVFAARHLGMARPVAFKQLRVGSDDPAAADRFLAEARLTASMDHPHVVFAHDYLEDESGAALVLEYAVRGSVRQHVRGGLGLAQAGGVLEDVLAGLAHLESRGIVHVDIKPDNLLVTASGRTVIADLGTARRCGPPRHAEAQNDPEHDPWEELVVGTPAYLAPELATGGRVGPWTDLYAVGSVAFALLVGRAPFAGSPDPVETVRRQLHDPVPRVSDLVPGMSPLVADWIEWLVAKDPSDRPPGAAEAWEGLERVLLAVLGPSWRLAAGL